MEAAKAFYADVVGWGTQDASMPGMPYTLFTAGKTSVSGMWTCRRTRGSWACGRAGSDMSASTTWTPPPTVSSALAAPCMSHRRTSPTSAASRRRRPANGDDRAAQVADTRPGQPAALSAPGRVGWHELLAADREKAFAFYAELFGWQKADADTGAVGTYQTVLRRRRDDRRHVHQAAGGAGPLLALLLQRRRHRCGGEAREGRRRPDPQRPGRSAGRKLGGPMHGPAGRHFRATGKAEPTTASDISSAPHRAIPSDVRFGLRKRTDSTSS